MARSIIIPNKYKPKLDILQTQVALKETKDFFEYHLAKALNLLKVLRSASC